MPLPQGQKSNLRGIAYMLAAGFAFVANDSLIKFTLSDLSGMQTLVLRGLAGCLWGLPALFVFGFGPHIAKAFSPWVLLRATCELVAIMAFIQALMHMAIGDVTAIYQIAPLLVTAGAAILWREPIRPLQFVLIGGALVGALLVAQPGNAAASYYVMFPFLTAIGAACRDLSSRRISSDTPGMVVAFSTIIVVLTAATGLHFTTESWKSPSTTNLLAMLLAGFFLLLAHTCMFLAYRHASAAAVAPFGYAVTAWAVLSGLLFFNEIPNGLALAGMALIVTSGVFAIIYEKTSS